MSKYETTAGIPTQGDTFAKMLHHLREAQDCAAMMSHLLGANDDKLNSQGWLGVEELLKRLCAQITKLATKKMN